MSKYHEYLHQKYRLTDYTNQISRDLFHIHRILTTYFPDSDTSTITEIQNLVDNKLRRIVNNIDDSGV